MAYQRTETFQPSGISTGGAAVHEGLSAALENFSGLVERVATPILTDLGGTAGEKAGAERQGGTRLPIGAYNRAYNEAFVRAYTLDVYADTEKDFLGLEQEAKGNPDLYAETASKRRDAILAEVHPAALPYIRQSIDERIKSTSSRLLTASMVTAKESMKAKTDRGLNTMQNDISRLLAAGDEESRVNGLKLAETYQNVVDQAVADGLYSPTEGQRNIEAALKKNSIDVALGQFTGELSRPDGNPAQFIAEIAKSNDPNFDDQTRKSLAAHMQSILNQHEGAKVDIAMQQAIENPQDTLNALAHPPGQTGVPAFDRLDADGLTRVWNAASGQLQRQTAASDARSSAADKYLTQKVSDGLKQYSMGFGLPSDWSSTSAIAKSLPADDPRRIDLLENVAALDELNRAGFLGVNPQRQKQMINNLDARLHREGYNPVDIRVMEIARKVQSDAESQANEDPYSFGKSRLALSDVPLEDLQGRADLGRQISAYLGKPSPGFSAEELSALGARYTLLSADDRMSLLGDIVKSHGQDDALTVFESLDKTPGSNSLMAMTGILTMDNIPAAKLVAAGQMAMQQNKDLVPTPTYWNPEVSAALGTAYGVGTHSRAMVEQSIEAAYAGMAAQDGDVSGDLDNRRLQVAIKAVTGGIVEYRGYQYPAPKRGVTSDEFQNWAENLRADDFAGVAHLTPEAALKSFRQSGWLNNRSVGGFQPVFESINGTDVGLMKQDGKPLILNYRPVTPGLIPEAKPFQLIL